jgi:spermidine synthase
MADIKDIYDLGLFITAADLIHEQKTNKNDLRIYHRPDTGNILTLNGEIQHVETWQSMYHECIVHVPLSFMTYPEKVVIFGGGSLFAASQILKYKSIKELYILDYDTEIFGIMAQHYAHVKAVLNDPRLTITEHDITLSYSQFTDGADFIVNDCCDLIDRGIWSGVNSYTNLGSRLSKDGLCCDVVYSSIFRRDYLAERLTLLKACPNRRVSLVSIPEYPGALHAMLLWGNNKHLNTDTRGEAVENLEQSIWAIDDEQINDMGLEFYDPRHRSAFLYCPPTIKKLL